eukprot:g14876.t1
MLALTFEKLRGHCPPQTAPYGARRTRFPHRQSGEIFSLLGFGALTSITLSLSLSESLFHTAWAIVLPWLPVVAALQVALFCRWKKLRAVLCREELRWDVEIAHSWCSSWGEFAALRIANQNADIASIVRPILLPEIFVTLAVLVLELSPYHVGLAGAEAGTAGMVLGSGLACLALLRGRMVVVESRFGSLPERLLRHELRHEASSMRSSVISGVGAEVPLGMSAITVPETSSQMV